MKPLQPTSRKGMLANQPQVTTRPPRHRASVVVGPYPHLVLLLLQDTLVVLVHAVVLLLKRHRAHVRVTLRVGALTSLVLLLVQSLPTENGRKKVMPMIYKSLSWYSVWWLIMSICLLVYIVNKTVQGE